MSPQEAREHSFDELARGLASGTLSRGKALRLMGAALVGGALASLPRVALADDDDCRGFGRRCRRDRQCCSKNFVRRGDDKVCGCPEGKSRCGGRCVTDCTGGTLNPQTCQCGCPSGQVLCNGNCVSTSCPTGQTLNTTTCQCECPSGTVTLSNGTCAKPCSGPCPGCFSCAQAISDNYCVNLDGSLAPCATDSECPTGEFCSGFICRVACTPSAPPV
jgi:hypothetical protein